MVFQALQMEICNMAMGLWQPDAEKYEFAHLTYLIRENL